ncbi:MAG: hypothetical protein GXY77_03665 [Fibrobacter sp.]|nr:hypothetical protein [Fibrobacter sp.]
MADKQIDLIININKPKLYVQKKYSGRGRKHSRLVTDQNAIRVDGLIAKAKDAD